MSSEDSDIELQSTLPKKIMKKMPRSPSEEMLKKNQEAKKLTTRDMINQALSDLKSRKGTSLYAIKKYIEEKYKVDTEKLNYIIKKSIKSGVETGVIVQIKGVGASGSFKLAPKDKAEKKKKPKKSDKKPAKTEKSDNPKKSKEPKSNEDEARKPKKKTEKPAKSIEKKEKSKKISEKATSDEAKVKEPKIPKAAMKKVTKDMQTPTKKKSAMMKRKSIGSIIKPPKMKPRKG